MQNILDQDLDIEEILSHIRAIRHLVDITGIAEDAGISRSVLANALDGRTDGRGYPIKIAQKHWKNLYQTIHKMTFLPK